MLKETGDYNAQSLADRRGRFLMKCTNETVTIELKTGKIGAFLSSTAHAPAIAES
jgi:hypothetical protein